MGLVVLFLFCVLSLFGATPEWIGKVIAIEGTAVAEKSGNIRDLAIDAAIFESDTISVGDDSRLQIRFTDGGLVNLIPNSIYRVNEYRYRIRKQKDRFAAEIIQGGFRSLSGSIAKKNPQNYELATPTSVVGLRGTLFEVNITLAGVYFGVEKGSIEIFNQGGRVVIGEKLSHMYAVVKSAEEKPEELSIRPMELNAKAFNPPRGAVDLTKHTVLPGSGISGQSVESSPTAEGGTTTTPSSESPSINLPGGGTGGGGVSIQGGC